MATMLHKKGKSFADGEDHYRSRENPRPKKSPRRSFKLLDICIALVVSFNVVLVVYLYFIRENNEQTIEQTEVYASESKDQVKFAHDSWMKQGSRQLGDNSRSSSPVQTLPSIPSKSHIEDIIPDPGLGIDLGRIAEKKAGLSEEHIPKYRVFDNWNNWVELGSPHGSIAELPIVALGDQFHYVPHFAIIGAQKGGTTYLRWLLVQHPHLESGDGLHGETRGEPHFFDWGYPNDRKASDKVSVMTKYAAMFHQKQEVGRSTLYFDTTPAYIVEKDVPQRIFSLIPNIKLIAIVRDPTDRYRSELQMEICRARLGQISNQFHRHSKMNAYLQYPPAGLHKPLKRGLYLDQFKTWLNLWSLSSILILTSELLYSQPEIAVKQVLKFLKIESLSPEFQFNYKAPKNAACKKDMSPFLDSEELAALKEYYLIHNQGLEELVDMKFSWLN